MIVSDAVNNHEPTRLALNGGNRVHKADELISAIVAKRLVEHLERWGFVVIKRLPIGGVAAHGRLHRAYDSEAFDPTVWGIFKPCEDEAVDGRNAPIVAVQRGRAVSPNRTYDRRPLMTASYGLRRFEADTSHDGNGHTADVLEVVSGG